MFSNIEVISNRNYIFNIFMLIFIILIIMQYGISMATDIDIEQKYIDREEIRKIFTNLIKEERRSREVEMNILKQEYENAIKLISDTSDKFLNHSKDSLERSLNFTNKSLEGSLEFSNRSLDLFSSGAAILELFVAVFSILQFMNAKKVSKDFFDTYKSSVETYQSNIVSITSLIDSVKNLADLGLDRRIGHLASMSPQKNERLTPIKG